MSNTDTQDWYRSELYTLAQYFGLEGRSDMGKEQLKEALSQEHPEALNPFAAVDGLEDGDVVEMNHLKSALTVQDVREADTHTSIVLTTPRGGRHKLVVPDDGEEVGKNGSSPHLERWRAGDSEWMNNSTDPVYVFTVSTADESEEDDG